MTALPSEVTTLEQDMAADLAAAMRLADEIRDRFAEYRRKRIKVAPQQTFRASSFGYKCDRRIYHDVKNWQQKAPVDPVVQGYFDRGNDMEPIVERYLSTIGLRIIESQTALFDDDLWMSMHPDGVLTETDSGRRIVVDIKSTFDPKVLHAWCRDDLMASDAGYRYVVQLHLAMRKMATYAALLIPWDGINWQPEPIPIDYDPELMDRLIARAQRIKRDHIDTNEPPEYIQDSRQCRICPHFSGSGGVCNPPISFGKGAQFLANEQLIEDLEFIEEHKALSAEVESKKARIKKMLRDESGDPQDGLFIAGQFEIHRKIGDRKGYTVQATKTQKIDWEKVQV